MAGVEQHGHGDGAVLGHIHRAHVAHFEIVGHGADRALGAFQDFEPDPGAVGQKRAAPAPGAEGADRGQRQQGGVDRQDRAVGGKIIGGRCRPGWKPGRRRRSVRRCAALSSTRMRILAAWRVWRSSETSLKASASVDAAWRYAPACAGDGPRRVSAAASRSIRSVLAVFVHQEADRAQIHAVDRLSRAEEGVQRLQHEAVAAQRDDDVGLVRARHRRGARAWPPAPRRRRAPR